MKTQLNDQLIKNHSKLFDGTSGFPSYMECDDGWYDIIDAALTRIQNYITNHNENIQSNIDWIARQPIGTPTPDYRKDTEFREYPQVQQVKEKFGALRLYVSWEDDYISGIIAMAEAMSARTCEVCGSHGERRGGSWLKTLCDQHHKEREEHRAKRYKTEEAWEQAIK